MSDTNEIIRQPKNTDYDKGFIDGLRCFSWWKDGTEFVGTCGKTLKSALEERTSLFSYGNKNLPSNVDIARLTTENILILRIMRELVDEIDNLENITFTRDLDPNEAETIWEDILSQAKNIVKKQDPTALLTLYKKENQC